MSKYLLSIAIGPVQDFIAAARQTRDLAFGSFLLSELSKACARFLEVERQANLIFPPAKLPRDFTVVNKILAEVDTPGEEGMRQLVADCGSAIRVQLSAEFGKAWKTARWKLPKEVGLDEARALKQIGEIIEIYAGWSLHEAANYKSSRQEAESRLASRKTLRSFRPFQGKPGVPKSSLDGVRETVIEWDEEPDNLFSIRYEEQLDAVGVLKRFGGNPPNFRFESTLDVAAVPYVAKLARLKTQELDEYRRFLSANRQEIPPSDSYLYRFDSRKVKGALAEELEVVVKPLREIRPQTPYYALLIGDGDSMGDALSAVDEIRAHQELSWKLSNFANRAQEIVKDHDGQAIYAGGDDLVALLPLHKALKCADKVRLAFGEALGGQLTFSAGLAVAHALEPLDHVRWLAKEAEKGAKAHRAASGKKKDALAIVVSPRSGVDEEAVGKWDVLIPKLTAVVNLYVSGKLSKSLGHDIRALLRQGALAGIDDETLVRMALAIGKKKHYQDEALELIGGAKTRPDLAFLVECLFVARPFARAIREANGE